MHYTPLTQRKVIKELLKASGFIVTGELDFVTISIVDEMKKIATNAKIKRTKYKIPDTLKIEAYKNAIIILEQAINEIGNNK